MRSGNGEKRRSLETRALGGGIHACLREFFDIEVIHYLSTKVSDEHQYFFSEQYLSQEIV